MTKYNFQTVTITEYCTYLCRCCKRKFTEKKSDWYSINPFTNKTPEQLEEEIRTRLRLARTECKHCGVALSSRELL